MKEFSQRELKKLYIPPPNSHKGQNGKLLIVAGSQLFHAPAIWPAQIASRIVDMVYVASTPENNEILRELNGKPQNQTYLEPKASSLALSRGVGSGRRFSSEYELKRRFWDGIVVRREDLDSYAKEADCILIGPGLPRKEGLQEGDDDSKELVKYVLCDLLPRSKFSHSDNHVPRNIFQRKSVRGVVAGVRKNGGLKSKKVVIDGGALQVMELEWIPKNAVLTPHRGEWEKLQKIAKRKRQVYKKFSNNKTDKLENELKRFADQYECIVLLKSGPLDIVCSPQECRVIKGGNAGMTKGGTGDVLAGLVAALACKNEPFLTACAASYLNKRAGDALFKQVGYYYNASDLVQEIPMTMSKVLSRWL